MVLDWVDWYQVYRIHDCGWGRIKSAYNARHGYANNNKIEFLSREIESQILMLCNQKDLKSCQPMIDEIKKLINRVDLK